MRIVGRDEAKNARESICAKRDGLSNPTDESDLQFSKHDEPSDSTLDGMRIDWSDELENTPEAIFVKCDGNSNAIDESD
jgi:hypothetical protein